jgi:glycosyl transferase, family 25
LGVSVQKRKRESGIVRDAEARHSVRPTFKKESYSVKPAEGQKIQILVISLERALNRRESVEAQLNQTGLEWSYIDAVDGRNPMDLSNYDRARRLSISGREMVPGQIGCFLSHRLAWRKVIQTNRTTLILEDDFSLRCNLGGILQIAADNAKAFDILRLHGVFPTRYKAVGSLGDRTLVKHFKDPRGTTAYILHPHTAERLLSRSSRFYLHVDDFFANTWLHRLSIRSLMPYPIGVVSCESLINDKNQTRLSLYRRTVKELHKFPNGWYAWAHRMWTYWMKDK